VGMAKIRHSSRSMGRSSFLGAEGADVRILVSLFPPEYNLCFDSSRFKLEVQGLGSPLGCRRVTIPIVENLSKFKYQIFSGSTS